MRIKLLSLVVTSFIAIFAMGQGFVINPGTTVKTGNGVSIVVQDGDLVNNGSGDLSNSNLYMTGSNPGNIGGTSVTTASNLYINKSSSQVLLENDLNVNNNVVFQNGLLDLNGHNLSLSSSGLLVNENEVNHIIGPLGGSVGISLNLNAPAGANPGNLGAIITCSKDMGRVTILRGHKAQTNNGIGTGILRYFDIQPQNNSALGATFRFTYLDAELNGLTESSLNMWKSTNGGSSWTKVTAIGSNTSLNLIDATVNVFSRYTLSSTTFSLTPQQSIAALDSRTSHMNKVSIALMPNPVTLQGRVLINSSIAVNSELVVYASNGSKIMEQPLSLRAGVNQTTVNTSALVAGLYYIVVDMQDGANSKIMFIKE
jgi:hypothetical protein